MENVEKYIICIRENSMKETQKKDITTQPAQAAGENKMGILPIRPLLLSMAWPAILSMTISALYNIVDSIFVAKLSEDALTAVSIVNPIQMLIIALSVGSGVGINSLIARRLGAHRQEEADQAASTGLRIGVFNYLVFLFPVTRKREARSTRRQSSICRLSASALSF